MNERVTSVFLAILLGWVIWGIASLMLPGIVALITGIVAGGLLVRFLRHSMALRGIIAVLDPMGVVLPILILRQVSGAIGLAFQPFGAAELLGFLALYIPFLAASFGVLPVDLYRFGYRPLPVALIVLALCLSAALTGHWIIALIAVAGQALWVFKIGSSNYFDHVLHATLVPLTIVVLMARMFG